MFGVVRLISDGVDQCCVGRLSEKYNKHLDLLDGRLAQITDLFKNSNSQHKIAFNKEQEGVCLCAIVDRYVAGDEKLNGLLDDIDYESD